MWITDWDHRVLVSPQGGSILQWQYKDRYILGPARTANVICHDSGPDEVVRLHEELKLRGETHWCFPNFGTPSAEYAADQPQHGRMRNTLLSFQKDQGGGAVTFGTLYPGHGDLTPARNLAAQVRVVLANQSLHIVLRAMNHGDERVPILPALHPYFAVPPGGIRLMIDGKTIEGKGIPSNDHPSGDMIFKRGNSPIYVHLLGIGRVTLETSQDCSHVVVWSDNSDEYVCVEPVFGKPGSYGTSEGRWLEPGEKFECSVPFLFDLA